MRNGLRLVLISMRNIKDSNAKAHYSMAKTLRKYFGDVLWFNPFAEHPKGLAARIRDRIRNRSDETATPEKNRAMAQVAAQRIEAFLRQTECDVVFAPNGAHLIALLQTRLPIIYTSDATRKLLDGYLLRTLSQPESLRRELHELEASALARVDLVIACTNWAARSMIQDYGVPSSRVVVINSGASLDWTPSAARAVRKSVSGACRLLLVGLNWTGKGCDTAVEVHRSLRRLGVPSELTICGCLPPSPVVADGLTILPKQDKNRYFQRRRLYRLYAESHLFLFPTRAECFGLSICEANANGLPVIARATGGTPEAVLDGVNGYVLPYDAPPEAYAEKIAEIWSNPDRYRELVIASRREYDTRLNWDVWGRQVAERVRGLVAQGSR